MKLPKFLQRKASKDDDDDDGDDDDFDFSEFEDDQPQTTVIDDDLDLDGNLGASADVSAGPDTGTPMDPFAEDSDGDVAVSDMSPENDPLFNDDHPAESDLGDMESPPDEAALDDDEDIPEFDLDDDFDGDDDGDDEEGAGEGGNNRAVIYVVAGFIVVMLGIIGGAGYWFLDLGGDEKTAEAPKQQDITSGNKVALTLKPRTGKTTSLNSLAANPDAGPSETAADADEQLADSQIASQTDSQAGAQSFADNGQQGLGGGSLNALAGGAQAPGTGVVIPATTVASFNAIPNKEKPSPLSPAPVKELLEQVSDTISLPKTGADGSQPWQVYARPYDERDTRKKVAILVTGLGLSRAATRAAISKLPPEVSLVFSPYAEDLGTWIFRARRAGHEAYVRLPMESKKFPLEDAGPLALSTSVQMSENMQRLNTVLGSFGGYVGVVSLMGSKFVTAEDQLRRILGVLKKRGLMLVDFGETESAALTTISSEIKLPVARVDLVLDEKPYKKLIDIKFLKLEDMMKSRNAAVATVKPYPSSLERLVVWAKSLKNKDLYLVPVSAIAGKQ